MPKGVMVYVALVVYEEFAFITLCHRELRYEFLWQVIIILPYLYVFWIAQYLVFYRFGIKAYATVSMKTDNTVSTSNCEYPLFVYCEETKCDDGEMRLNTLRNNI